MLLDHDMMDRMIGLKKALDIARENMQVLPEGPWLEACQRIAHQIEDVIEGVRNGDEIEWPDVE